jgi:hypothetical protein
LPAYRSEAEAEIRNEVVKRLRELIPGCRIIHEINVESFGNRIDVLAVGDNEIAAVEIKSKKDKLDRLEAQASAMKRVSNRVFIALHERFLTKLAGGYYPPDGRYGYGSTLWAYPIMDRPGHVECSAEWREGKLRGGAIKNLPCDAIFMLWRDELHCACRSLGIKGVAKLTMVQAADELRWRLTGEQITRLICAKLKARKCVEADQEREGDYQEWVSSLRKIS